LKQITEYDLGFARNSHETDDYAQEIPVRIIMSMNNMEKYIWENKAKMNPQ
jgi:hypothetical protein